MLISNLENANHFLPKSFKLAPILLSGVLHVEWYLFVPFIFIFATLVSFMITAIQIGVFVEGKPIFGLTHIYKYLPYLTLAIFVSTFSMWFFRVFAV